MSVLLTFAVGIASALVPVISIEAWLLGVAVVGHAPAWLLALAAGAGQMAGKMIFYSIGRGVGDPNRWRRFRTEGTASGRWARSTASAQAWAGRHVWGPAALTAVSAVLGLPPFAVMSVLAGTLGLRWWLFLVIGLLGRSLRFITVLLFPHLLPSHWLDELHSLISG